MFLGLVEARINELLMNSGQSFAQKSNDDKKVDFYDPALIEEQFKRQFGLDVGDEDDEDAQVLTMKDFKKNFPNFADL